MSVTGLVATTKNGASSATFLSDNSTKAGVIKASPGNLYGIHASNVNAGACFIKLYNKITAPTTSDTPVWRAAVPGSTAGGVRDIPFPVGLEFTVGIAYRIVTTAPDNGDTACASNEVLANFSYE